MTYNPLNSVVGEIRAKSTINVLPTPLAVAWVNRWTFSSPPPISPPSPPPSHLQLLVSLRYRKRHVWAWVLLCDAILFDTIIKIYFRRKSRYIADL